MRRVLISFLLLSLFIAVASLLGFYNWLQRPIAFDPPQQTILIEQGEGIGHLAYRLHNQGLLPTPRLMTLYARLTGLAAIKQGEYLISGEITPQQLLQQLVDGKVIQYRLTLVEGWTLQQAVAFIQAQPHITTTLKSAEDIAQWFAEQKLSSVNPEGWLLPETYLAARGTTDQQIMTRALVAMQTVLDEEWPKRAPGLPYKSPYEALIMASIVEKETGVPYERAEIAGVFVRRLQLGMRLQTDPTVIYGMGEQYSGNIRKKDLLQSTPYNTYTINGLPPTPIALPGRDAIVAALHPAAGDTLFFVAKGDGSHQFSVTLREHEAAVKKYQMQRKQDYRSAPAPAPAPAAPASTSTPKSAPMGGAQ